MPITRTKLNLRNTSIQEHLLVKKTETKSTGRQKEEERMPDQKSTGEPLDKTELQGEVITTNNKNSHARAEPPNELFNSVLVAHNNQPKAASMPLLNRRYPADTTSDAGQQAITKNYLFSGENQEDEGQWLDYICETVEQKGFTPVEQRDIAVASLAGEALLWYRLNRLKMPDMQSFIHQFLLCYNPLRRRGMTESVAGKEAEQTSRVTPNNIMDQRQVAEPSCRSTWPSQVLQSARNEKVKSFPNFSGMENSLYWLKNLQQIGKALKLDDQQIYELATIKLSGPAQEWFYQQDKAVEDWSSFRMAFLHAFPPPIQPTNIDYLAQLLARQQGETEPVGKYVQDVNRLCLKLDEKITEQDKLQFLRRGLRPQLQHYALSITSLEDFLTILQRHEQIEKQITTSFYSSHKAAARSNQQQYSAANRPQSNYRDTQQTQRSAGSLDLQATSNVEEPTQRFEKENRICYQCNKRGHLQWNCPDNNRSHQHYDNHQQPAQRYQQQNHPEQQPYQQQQQPYGHQQYQPQQNQQHFQERGY